MTDSFAFQRRRVPHALFALCGYLTPRVKTLSTRPPGAALCRSEVFGRRLVSGPLHLSVGQSLVLPDRGRHAETCPCPPRSPYIALALQSRSGRGCLSLKETL